MGYDSAAFAVLEISKILGAGVSGIKQIQRGTTSFSSISNLAVTTGITVVPEKTMVFVESDISGAVTGLSLGNNEYGLVYHSLVNSVSATTITLTPCYAQVGAGSGNRVYGKCYWQVIEFY